MHRVLPGRHRVAELPHTLQLQAAFFLFGVKLPWCILGEGIAQRCSVKHTKLTIFTGPYNLHHARLQRGIIWRKKKGSLYA